VALPVVPDPASSVAELSYAGEPGTLGRARRDVLELLSHWGADAAVQDRAALIVSELATNALQAAPGTVYHVHVTRLDNDYASIAVRNASNGTVPPQPEKWRPVDRTALRGRGLSIVGSLADGVTVDTTAGEVVVTARLRIR
jgi:anti-sigma regulatory factor (Ser/Thr protein kinase)